MRIAVSGLAYCNSSAHRVAPSLLLCEACHRRPSNTTASPSVELSETTPLQSSWRFAHTDTCSSVAGSLVRPSSCTTCCTVTPNRCERGTTMSEESALVCSSPIHTETVRPLGDADSLSVGHGGT